MWAIGRLWVVLYCCSVCLVRSHVAVRGQDRHPDRQTDCQLQSDFDLCMDSVCKSVTATSKQLQAGSFAQAGKSTGGTSVCIQVVLRPALSSKVFHDIPRSYGEFSVCIRNPRSIACFSCSPRNIITSSSSGSPQNNKTEQYLRVTG